MRGIVIAVLVALAVGIGIGWLLGLPAEDWRLWKDRVVRYQQDSVAHVARQDSLRQQRDSALRMAQAARDSARLSQARADRERALRLAHQQRADSFSVLLAQATTPADSLRACISELMERRREASTCQQEAASLRAALRQDSVAIEKSAIALALEQEAHQATRNRLSRADSLLQIAPAPQGCALPLCTALSLELEPWDRTFFVGVSIPIRTWVRAGVVRRLTR